MPDRHRASRPARGRARPWGQPPKTLRLGSGDATAVASVTMGAPAVKARSSDPMPAKVVHGQELRAFTAGAPIVTDATAVASPEPNRSVFGG